MPAQWWDPYTGLPGAVQVLMWFLLAVTLLTFATACVLIVVARSELRRQRRDVCTALEDEYLWVYLVPALNEDVTIADSVHRLAAVEATHKVIVVIDDGSDDGTPGVLAALRREVPALTVLRREPPNARLGKGAGLDNAWQLVHDEVMTDPRYAGWPPEKVVVGVVDADGRIQPDAPRIIAGVLADERVGGVQVLVRIYNRGTYLTWGQDVEFGVTAFVHQLGRSSWGTANMGGNSQYMRLATLDDVAGTQDLPPGIGRGPWRDRLTEDQDIGVRAIHAGWRGAQTVLTWVDQQGVTDVRRLLRQRVRWAQGAWQCVGMVRQAHKARTGALGRLDHYVYLVMPILQLAMGLGLLLSAFFLVFRGVPFYSGWWPTLVFFLAVGILPGFAALLVTAEPGRLRVPRAVLGLVPYIVYTWLLWPAIPIALVRETFGIRGWTKTVRNPLDANLPKGVTPDRATPT
jgi:cellulose synthase/poly-beta-1,6-N-acetylglucosamine synthase-like glycosyltransferase